MWVSCLLECVLLSCGLSIWDQFVCQSSACVCLAVILTVTVDSHSCFLLDEVEPGLWQKTQNWASDIIVMLRCVCVCVCVWCGLSSPPWAHQEGERENSALVYLRLGFIGDISCTFSKCLFPPPPPPLFSIGRADVAVSGCNVLRAAHRRFQENQPTNGLLIVSLVKPDLWLTE